MKEYLESIVKPILKEPDQLVTEETQDAMGTLLAIRVSKNDMGTCVGKDGKMAEAIRHLMRVYGGQNKARVSVRFLEPLGSNRYTETVTETK